MKRTALHKRLRKFGCVLKREGRSHSLWTNPQTGQVEAVLRQAQVSDNLARTICCGLSVPEAGKT